jgi:ubiquitin-activating enzyme E1
METMGKLIKMKVVIQGLRGLGVETAKNLILAGPHTVHLYDPTPVAMADLASNFYCREEDVGKKSRAEASVEKLQELNPYVKVAVIPKLGKEELANYDFVCVTEVFGSIDDVIELNEAARSAKKGFLLSQTLGLAGYAFVDFGDEFLVRDADGEDTKSFIVVNIS